MGGFVVQDLGATATVMKGDGEFFRRECPYSTFLELQAVFSEGAGADAGTPGLADGRRVFYGAGADAGSRETIMWPIGSHSAKPPGAAGWR